MKSTVVIIIAVIGAYVLGICQARPPTPPSNKPIINQEVLRQHQKLFSQQVSTEPGESRLEAIEKLGMPIWKGRWTK